MALEAVGWRPARRLRHVNAVSIFNLYDPESDSDAAYQYEIDTWDAWRGDWTPFYRSEQISANHNLEWEPQLLDPESETALRGLQHRNDVGPLRLTVCARGAPSGGTRRGSGAPGSLSASLSPHPSWCCGDSGLACCLPPWQPPAFAERPLGSHDPTDYEAQHLPRLRRPTQPPARNPPPPPPPSFCPSHVPVVCSTGGDGHGQGVGASGGDDPLVPERAMVEGTLDAAVRRTVGSAVEVFVGPAPVPQQTECPGPSADAGPKELPWDPHAGERVAGRQDALGSPAAGLNNRASQGAQVGETDSAAGPPPPPPPQQQRQQRLPCGRPHDHQDLQEVQPVSEDREATPDAVAAGCRPVGSASISVAAGLAAPGPGEDSDAAITEVLNGLVAWVSRHAGPHRELAESRAGPGPGPGPAAEAERSSPPAATSAPESTCSGSSSTEYGSISRSNSEECRPPRGHVQREPEGASRAGGSCSLTMANRTGPGTGAGTGAGTGHWLEPDCAAASVARGSGSGGRGGEEISAFAAADDQSSMHASERSWAGGEGRDAGLPGAGAGEAAATAAAAAAAEPAGSHLMAGPPLSALEALTGSVDDSLRGAKWMTCGDGTDGQGLGGGAASGPARSSDEAEGVGEAVAGSSARVLLEFVFELRDLVRLDPRLFQRQWLTNVPLLLMAPERLPYTLPSALPQPSVPPPHAQAGPRGPGPSAAVAVAAWDSRRRPGRVALGRQVKPHAQLAGNDHGDGSGGGEERNEAASLEDRAASEKRALLRWLMGSGSIVQPLEAAGSLESELLDDAVLTGARTTPAAAAAVQQSAAAAASAGMPSGGDARPHGDSRPADPHPGRPASSSELSGPSGSGASTLRGRLSAAETAALLDPGPDPGFLPGALAVLFGQELPRPVASGSGVPAGTSAAAAGVGVGGRGQGTAAAADGGALGAGGGSGGLPPRGAARATTVGEALTLSSAAATAPASRRVASTPALAEVAGAAYAATPGAAAAAAIENGADTGIGMGLGLGTGSSSTPNLLAPAAAAADVTDPEARATPEPVAGTEEKRRDLAWSTSVSYDDLARAGSPAVCNHLSAPPSPRSSILSYDSTAASAAAAAPAGANAPAGLPRGSSQGSLAALAAAFTNWRTPSPPPVAGPSLLGKDATTGAAAPPLLSRARPAGLHPSVLSLQRAAQGPLPPRSATSSPSSAMLGAEGTSTVSAMPGNEFAAGSTAAGPGLPVLGAFAALAARVPAAGGVQRMCDLPEVRASIRRLTELQERLHAARVCCLGMRQRLAAAAEGQQRQEHLRVRAEAARADAVWWAARAAAAESQLAALREAAAVRRSELRRRALDLEHAAGVLKGAEERRLVAEAQLAGPTGRGQLAALMAALVGRRNRLVAELGRLFQIGPVSAALLQPDPLELTLDSSWAGGAELEEDEAEEAGEDSDGGAGAGAGAGVRAGAQHAMAQTQELAGGADGPGRPNRILGPQSGTDSGSEGGQQATWTGAGAGAAPGGGVRARRGDGLAFQGQQRQQQQQQQQYDAGMLSAGLADGGQLVVAQPAAAGRRQAGGARVWTPPRPTRLAVMGLELPPDLIERTLQGTSSWSPLELGRTYDADQRTAAGLGYVAAVVDLAASYLGVPLRYPIAPRVSVSYISDPVPPSVRVRAGGAPVSAVPPLTPLPPPGPSAAASAAAAPGGEWRMLSLATGALGAALGAAAASAAALPPPPPPPPAVGLIPGPRGVGVSGRLAVFSSLLNASLDPWVAGTPAGALGDDAHPAGLNPAAGLPLFWGEGARDRTRFAYAVYLLCKDLEQLLAAHGIPTVAPNQPLQNLYVLVTAAASGVSHRSAPARAGVVEAGAAAAAGLRRGGAGVAGRGSGGPHSRLRG